MADAVDLSRLTPEILQQLLALAAQGVGTRSPAWKPLKDLRVPQTASGRINRPHFEFSAETPPEGTTIPPFPRLFWNERGEEVRIESEDDMMTRVKENWTALPPNAAPMTPQQLFEREMSQLSPEDRQIVIEAHKKSKLARIQEQMSALSAGELKSITAAMALESAAAAEPSRKKAS